MIVVAARGAFRCDQERIPGLDGRREQIDWEMPDAAAYDLLEVDSRVPAATDLSDQNASSRNECSLLVPRNCPSASTTHSTLPAPPRPSNQA